MATVTIQLEVDETKLWEATFGSEPFNFPWWRKAKFLGDADWDKPGEIEVAITDPNNEERGILKTLNKADLTRAYEWLMNNPRYHCGGMRIAVDIEDFDACEGDVLLQVAMLGQDYYS